MRRGPLVLLVIVALTAGLVAAGVTPATATHGGDTRVSIGSPPSPFSQNKQNEPAVTIDPAHPSVVAAGANEEIDLEACNAGDPTDCPFTDGVSVSGIYFSFNSGDSWTQPTYQGWTARHCLGSADSDDTSDECQPGPGPIGTLPKYYENRLIADGDPALVFGPQPGPHGFSWSNGSRLYYANLTANFTADGGEGAFNGFEAIAVSRTDNPQAAATGANSAWKKPVIISKQSSTTFSDKEQIYVDQAENTSPYFGNVYVCVATYRGQEKASAFPQALTFVRSTDGGNTWSQQQLTSAGVNSQQAEKDGCTVRTDSKGNVYVFWFQNDRSGGAEYMTKSTNGGKSFGKPRRIITGVVRPGVFEPATGRPVMDGIGGARVDLAPSPSVDIANGAPTGANATDELVMTWADARDGLNNEKMMLAWSTNGGGSWTIREGVETGANDRPFYTAPAISPDGTDLYTVYNAFLTPYRPNTTQPRSLVGVVQHANITGSTPGALAEIHRGATGDPRGSSQNDLTAEFLGDYVYAWATNNYGVAVWNDTRNAADCPAIDAYRQDVHDAAAAAGRPLGGEEPGGEREDQEAEAAQDEPVPPSVQEECPANFGNSDIYGGSYADPS